MERSILIWYDRLLKKKKAPQAEGLDAFRFFFEHTKRSLVAQRSVALLLSSLRDAPTGQGAKRDAFEGTLVERVQLNGGRLAVVVAVSGITFVRLCMYILQQYACICMYDNIMLLY